MKVPEAELDSNEMFHNVADLHLDHKKPDNLDRILLNSQRTKKKRKKSHFKRKFKMEKNNLDEDSQIINSNSLMTAEVLEQKYGLNIMDLFSALKRLDEYTGYEYEDQKNFIPNIINLISSGTLSPSSLAFAKMSTLIRMLLSSDDITPMPGYSKILVTFRERDVIISKKEFEAYSKYNEQEDVYRAILGLLESIETTRRTFSEKIRYYGQMMLDYQKELNDTNMPFSLQSYFPHERPEKKSPTSIENWHALFSEKVSNVHTSMVDSNMKPFMNVQQLMLNSINLSPSIDEQFVSSKNISSEAINIFQLPKPNLIY